MATGNDYFLGSEQLDLDSYFDSQGKWLPRLAYEGVANGVATLDANTKVVQEPASKGQANGVASLDANGRLVENPDIASKAAADAAGADFLIEKSGSIYKATGNAAQGPVILDAQGNVISSKSFKLPSGADITARAANLIHEASGEYDHLYWYVDSGSLSVNFDTRYGGIHHFATAAFTAWTAARVYNSVNNRDYYLLFEDLGTDRLDYKVELYAYDGQTLKATLIDWTQSQAGLNVISLGDLSTWPTDYTTTEWQAIRVYFRGTSSGSYRIASVSLSYDAPYYPDRTLATTRYYEYRHGCNISSRAGYQGTTTVASGGYAYFHRNLFKVEGGWRLRVGVVRYSIYKSSFRLHLKAEYDGTSTSWQSSVNEWEGVLNLTLVPTRSAATTAKVVIAAKNISSSSDTIYKDDGVAVYIQAVPL